MTETAGATQTPPSGDTASPSPKPGQPGYKPSRDTLKKMQAGRREKEDKKKKDREARDAARAAAGAQKPPAPSVSSAIPEKTRRKIAEKVVAPAIGILESAGFFAARLVTAPAVPLGDDGRPSITELEYIAAVQEHRRSAFQEDRLEKWERDWLADELTNELMRWPRVRALLLQLLAIAERGGLLEAVSVIIGFRMVRHGMIPESFRELAAEMIEAQRAARKKLQGVKDEAGDASSNGASAGTSPHFTEPTPVG